MFEATGPRTSVAMKRVDDYYYTKSWQALLMDTDEEYEEIISALNHIVPKTTHVYNNLAVAYMEMGKEEMVLPSLAKAIDLDPNNAIAYITAANFHSYYTRDLAQMEWNYTQAIKINPMNPSFYNGRAWVYLQQYDKAELAYSDYRRSYELNPKNEYVIKEIRMLETLLSVKPEDRLLVKRSWKERFMEWLKGK